MNKEDISEVKNQLYRMRRNAKTHFKTEYNTKIEPFTDLIKTRMRQHDIDALTAMCDIMLLHSIQSNPMAQLLLVAATAELVDPALFDTVILDKKERL